MEANLSLRECDFVVVVILTEGESGGVGEEEEKGILLAGGVCVCCLALVRLEQHLCPTLSSPYHAPSHLLKLWISPPLTGKFGHGPRLNDTPQN